MGHRSSQSKSWDLVFKVENCSGDVNFGCILSKHFIHVHVAPTLAILLGVLLNSLTRANSISKKKKKQPKTVKTTKVLPSNF